MTTEQMIEILDVSVKRIGALATTGTSVPLAQVVAHDLKAVLRALSSPVGETPEHRCGVRGFAESGDKCPACAESRRRFLGEPRKTYWLCTQGAGYCDHRQCAPPDEPPATEGQ